MTKLKPALLPHTEGAADAAQIYTTDTLRITVLTPQLIRVETLAGATDLPTQTVWFRKFDVKPVKITQNGKATTVETEAVVFTIKGCKPYSVYLKTEQRTLRFARQKNLKGTYRTLDGTVGRIPLGDGLLTKDGAYLLDDSRALLLDADGHFVKRREKASDYYAFAYGKAYRETICAFYAISAPVPLIPRFALGVWWSRYYAYTQQEYLDLIAEFKRQEIPLTVATVDMDWHWVKKEDIQGRLGATYKGCGTYGWTGYSWNTELFPDYKAFLRRLRADGLRVTLNLHPADGVHPYETMYTEMAQAVGADPAAQKKIPFQCGNDAFWNAYFDVLHKPYEQDGVDFWWIDWQQGKKSDVDGLDPLWALNHYHFLDNAQSGTLPLILSRYAGLGSHRYPLGFSGDTAMTWRVLAFQPYFTINAANCAYTWWSHDIGGHHEGYRDDELYLRWLEFGVFSPILRLHSTAIDFLGKEPWKYRADVFESAKRWLRLRHRLIPYLYTMDYRNHAQGLALCEPMYYAYPEKAEAFAVPNQYHFGSELLVCPITKKASRKTGFGSVEAWLPPGEYTDIFTLQTYRGEQHLTLNRQIYDLPVLAKAGAILPLSAQDGNDCANPAKLEIWVFRGDNRFTLYEDSGQTDYAENHVQTEFINRFADGTLHLTVKAPVGNRDLLPSNRSYRFVFRNTVSEDVTVSVPASVTTTKDGEVVVDCACADEDIEIVIKGCTSVKRLSYREQVIDIFSRWQASTAKKQLAYRAFAGKRTKAELTAALQKARLPKAVRLLLEELLCETDRQTQDAIGG